MQQWRSVRAAAFWAAGVCLAAVAAWLLWRTADRVQALEGELAAARQQVAAFALRLTEVAEQAAESRARSEFASRKAEEAVRGRLLAESETEAARGEAKQSGEAARQAREELQALKARRERELDRMQDALGRIAKTSRTATGMIVELGQDSFRFDFDSAELRPENRELLSRIAGVLLASKGYRLSIHGHTDQVGTAEYNVDLSRRRAEAVARYLKECGIGQEVLETRGFGKSSPRAQGNDEQARQRNRRVEIAIVDSIIDYHGIAGPEREL